MLWCQDFCPVTLDACDLHPVLAQRLKKIGTPSYEMCNLFLYGPQGCGKKTLARALVKSRFPALAFRVDKVKRIVKATESKKLTIHTLRSKCHMEVNLADAYGYAKEVLRDIIEEFASLTHFEMKGQQRIVLLLQPTVLDFDAQMSIVNMMDKYAKTCRFILCCTQLSSLINPIRSRCLCIRVPAPSPSHILTILSKRTQHMQFPQEVVRECKGNVRRALLILQHWHEKGELTRPHWEQILVEMVNKIKVKESVAVLLKARIRLNDILSSWGIPAKQVLAFLIDSFLTFGTDKFKFQVVRWGAHYDSSLNKSNKPLFQIEAFLAKMMEMIHRRK